MQISHNASFEHALRFVGPPFAASTTYCVLCGAQLDAAATIHPSQKRNGSLAVQAPPLMRFCSLTERALVQQPFN